MCQLFGIILAYHHHLAVFLNVDGIHKASFEHLHLLYLGIARVHSVARCALVVVAVGECHSPLAHCGSCLVHIPGERGACNVEVRVAQLYWAPFLQSAVGFRCLSAEHTHRVAYVAVLLLQLGVYQSVAGS